MGAPADRAARQIVLAPIAPAVTGNGLAMRTALFCRSSPAGVDVVTVVVPVAGALPTPPSPWPGVTVVPLDPVGARAGSLALLADARWRDRLGRAGPLPGTARAGSPGLVDAVAAACSGDGPVALHVMRSYLAPLAIAVAERIGATSATLDLDDDDVAYAKSIGDREGAAAYERMITVFAPLFDARSAASALEADAMAIRYGLAVQHLPNAVDLPDPPRGRRSGSVEPCLLFVGNLTYPPNAEAARVLVEAVLPRVRRRLGAGVRVLLVGNHHRDLERLAGPTVELAGYVADLDAMYERADVVVAPITTGAGTRIKLLEAFAHDVPVVAWPVAASGLAVTGGHHLLLVEDPEQAAAAVEAVLTDAALAARLVAAARALVRDDYCVDVVEPRIREFLAAAASRARDRGQPAWS